MLGGVIGCLGGLLGTAFHYSLHFVTALRAQHNWLIFLLPIAGLLSVGLYSLFRLGDNKGTNEIIAAVLNKKAVKPLIAPAIFISALLTHLFGASGGREGAALQLGGSVASSVSGLLRLKEQERAVLTLTGMSAVFSGLFGTPLTAAVFCVEFLSVGTVFSPALLPCYLAAFISSTVSRSFGVHAETAEIPNLVMNISNVCGIAIICIAVALLGMLMCTLFRGFGKFSSKLLPNRFIRIFIGAIVIIALTLTVGDQRYNGAGMDMALRAISGQADWFDFMLKLAFTAVTLAAGFKGGEIVPTFCIGATFGCFLGGVLGIDPGLAAAFGLIGLFCSATNAPLASIILSAEMFGIENLHIFALICIISFAISGEISLYSSQERKNSKLFFNI